MSRYIKIKILLFVYINWIKAVNKIWCSCSKVALKKCQRVNINLNNSRKPSPSVSRRNNLDEKWDPRALEEALLAAKLAAPGENNQQTEAEEVKKSKERIKVQRSRTIHTINTANIPKVIPKQQQQPASPLRGSASMTALYSLGKQLQAKVSHSNSQRPMRWFFFILGLS